MIKTTNIIPALIRKVNPPIKLYKSPPNISPTIMAMLTCLYFWVMAMLTCLYFGKY